MDPMHTFRNIIERQIVYLDDATVLQKSASRYARRVAVILELGTAESLVKEGEAARRRIQDRLDTEIPVYLPRLPAQGH